MSWNPALDPGTPTGDAARAIETVIIPRARDLGAFEVRRALPAPERQMVGPYIFFDQVGPAELLPPRGVDVRPHPHIGLATVTYLYAGRMHHRDNLGNDSWIEAGDVNWMSAGHGITHSERTDDATWNAPMKFFGAQTWVALPKDHEDGTAWFHHTSKAELPFLEGEGKSVRLIAGTAWGEASPVAVPMEMFHADALLAAGASLPLPDEHEDRGAFVMEGEISVAGESFEAGRMVVFRPGDRVAMTAGPRGARVMLVGGATLEGPRYIWWNFVASSLERIEEAKEAWARGDWEHNPRFQLPVGDKGEFIPLPER